MVNAQIIKRTQNFKVFNVKLTFNEMKGELKGKFTLVLGLETNTSYLLKHTNRKVVKFRALSAS